MPIARNPWGGRLAKPVRVAPRGRRRAACSMGAYEVPAWDQCVPGVVGPPASWRFGHMLDPFSAPAGYEGFVKFDVSVAQLRSVLSLALGWDWSGTQLAEGTGVQPGDGGSGLFFPFNWGLFNYNGGAGSPPIFNKPPGWDTGGTSGMCIRRPVAVTQTYGLSRNWHLYSPSSQIERCLFIWNNQSPFTFNNAGVSFGAATRCESYSGETRIFVAAGEVLDSPPPPVFRLVNPATQTVDGATWATWQNLPMSRLQFAGFGSSGSSGLEHIEFPLAYVRPGENRNLRITGTIQRYDMHLWWGNSAVLNHTVFRQSLPTAVAVRRCASPATYSLYNFGSQAFDLGTRLALEAAGNLAALTAFDVTEPVPPQTEQGFSFGRLVSLLVPWGLAERVSGPPLPGTDTLRSVYGREQITGMKITITSAEFV